MSGETVYCDDYEAITGKPIPAADEQPAPEPETKVITPESAGVETGA